MTSIDLSFDGQIIESKKLEKFLQQNPEYHSKGYDDNGEIVTHIHSNKIYLSTYDEIKSVPDKQVSSTGIMNLIEKIETNADLFCSLEFSLRKIPVEHVKNFDLKLLINNLKYQCSYENAHKDSFTEIIMTAETPLACLGCIAQTDYAVTIVSTKETAAVCTLFVKLCDESGFGYPVGLMLVSEPPSDLGTFRITNIKEFATGCLGVVSNKADVDSAVDNFLYASNQYPWIIKKILVQESALDRFKKAIEWKTKKPSGDVKENLIRLSTNVYVYEDKVYLYEYVGNIENLPKNSVIIEGYRTNKELVSIMSEYKPFCVSLWSSDISETNEIISTVDTTIIWVNDYGNFDGPPISSQGFYSPLQKRIKTYPNLKLSDMTIKRKNWLKLDQFERFKKIRDALKDFKNEFEKEFEIKLGFHCNSTMSFGNKVFMAERTPFENMVVGIKKFEDILYHLEYIIDAGAIHFVTLRCVDDVCGIDGLVDALHEATGGCVEHYIGRFAFEKLIPYRPLLYRTKTIWTSNGTTFAN